MRKCPLGLCIVFALCLSLFPTLALAGPETAFDMVSIFKSDTEESTDNSSEETASESAVLFDSQQRVQRSFRIERNVIPYFLKAGVRHEVGFVMSAQR